MPEILGIAVTSNGHVHTLETGGRIVRCSPAPAEVLHLGRERMDGFFASADGALHAVGSRYHTNARGAWTSEKVERKNRFGSMTSVWVPSPGDVWVGDSSGEVLRRGASGWTSIDTGLRKDQTVHFIGGAGPDDVYVGGCEIRHFDGEAWRALKAPARNLFLSVARWRGGVYFAGYDGLYARDGAAVTRVALEGQKVYALAATDAELFVATGGPVLSWNGAKTRIALDFGGYRVATNGSVATTNHKNNIHVVGQGMFVTADKNAKPKSAKPKSLKPKSTTRTATKPKAPTPPDAQFQRFRFFEHKFFDVAVAGAVLVTRSGFIGKDATEKVKSYASADAAEAARDKLIAEKTSKGFRPVG